MSQRRSYAKNEKRWRPKSATHFKEFVKSQTATEKIHLDSPKEKIDIVKSDGTIDVYTGEELKRMAMLSGTLDKNYIVLMNPSTIVTNNDVTNGGSDNTNQLLANAIVMNAVASAPHLDIPGCVAYLVAYLIWAFIQKFRDVRDTGLTGPPAAYSTNTINEFDERTFAIPVAWASFLEHLMPYHDKETGADFKYQIDFPTMFSASAGVFPSFSGPSISSAAGVANYFNVSPFGNQVLTERARTTTGPNGALEVGYGLNPNAFVPSLADMFARGSAISNYWKEVGTYTTLSKIPWSAPDGSGHSLVNSSSTTYPAIFSNCSKFDPELTYIFKLPSNAATSNVSQTTFKKIRPLSPVLFDYYPTTVPTIAPAQAAVICNYAYIMNMCKYCPGGGRMAHLKTIEAAYPKIRSYMPNYFSIDTSALNELSESSLLIANQITQNNTGTLGAAPTANSISGGYQQIWPDFVCATLVPIMVLLTRMQKFAWPGIVFYTNSDVASMTAVASDFANVKLPPPIASLINGIGPVVVGGKLQVPLLDWRSPALIGGPGTSFVNQDLTLDPNSGRWLQICESVAGSPYLPMFTPSTALATVINPPTSLNRRSPFASGLCPYPATPFFPAVILGGATIDAVSLGIQGDITPGAASIYAPVVPNRFAKDFIMGFVNYYQSCDATFVAIDDNREGNIAQLSVMIPVTQYSTVTQAGGSITLKTDHTSAGTQLFVQPTIDFIPQSIGSQLPLDAASLGNVIMCAYRTTLAPTGSFNKGTSAMPYVHTVASSSSPYDILIMESVKNNTGQNSWLVDYSNKTAHGMSPIQATRTLLEPFLSNIAGLHGEPRHVGAAVVLVMGATRSISAAPFDVSKSKNYGIFQSPDIMNEAKLISRVHNNGGGTVAGVRLPVLSPLLEAGKDLFSLFFG